MRPLGLRLSRVLVFVDRGDAADHVDQGRDAREAAERPAGRPPKGEIAQEISKTATRAHIACQLAGRHDSAFLNGLGVAVNPTAVERAGSDVTWHPDPYVPPGPEPSAAAKAASPQSATARARADRRAGEPALREWLAVDYQALNVSLAIVTIDAADRARQLSLYAALRDIPGVVQALRLLPNKQWPVIAVVAWDGEADSRRIIGRLDELDASWGWQPIETRTVRPAEATWRHLARVAATDEDLRL